MSVNTKRLIGFLFLLQTLFLASTFRTWLAVCAVATISGLVVFVRQRRTSNQWRESSSRLPRWLLRMVLVVTFAGIVGVTTAWRLSNQFGESINPIYVAIDVVSHAALFASLVVWTMRPNRGHVSMLPLGLLVVLLCVAAGGASQSFAAQSTVALATCLGFSLASQAILGAACGSTNVAAVGDSSVDGNATWMGPLFSMITLSILLMATSMIANATSLALPSFQDKLQKKLQESFDAVGDELYFGGTRYVRGSRLGAIRRHILADPQEIALRVHSAVSPGYLRGHAFDLYRSRQWFSAGANNNVPLGRMPSLRDHVVNPSGLGTATLEQPLRRPLHRFELDGSGTEHTTDLEIHNDPLKGHLVFLPLTTRWLEAKSSELVVTNHGIVRLGVDVTMPYVAGVGRSVLRKQLEPQLREVLLEVPPHLSRETKRVADQVCGSLPTTPTKIAAISRFFQREFSYSLTTTKSPRGVDPIAYFLRTRHDAHCEFFASATVLVLRSAGIPTRYVTGYVVDEFSTDESMWLARNRDAHAWAEAYDESTGLWIPVESTPGRSYQTVDPNATMAESSSFFDVFGLDDGDDSDTILGRTIGWLFSIRATDPLMIVFRFAQLPLFCVLAFLLWSKYLKPTRNEFNPIDHRSRKMLRKVERRLRKHSLVRMPSETLYQFADRIDPGRVETVARPRGDNKQMLSDVSRWYRDYANARYQGELPKPYG